MWYNKGVDKKKGAFTAITPMKKLLILCLALLCVLALFACGPQGGGQTDDGTQGGPTNDSQGDGILQEGGDNAANDLLWDTWTHTKSKTFYSQLANDNSTTITVKVRKGSASFLFTVKTTATTLRPALLGSGFAVSGDLDNEAFYRVNGVRAQSGYAWVLTREGDSAPLTPLDSIQDGDVFVFTYTAVAE